MIANITNPPTTETPLSPQRGSPHHHIPYHNQPREVIELSDSDTENRNNVAGRLQPPFDPIPRSTGPTSTKSGHRASATPTIASLINSDAPPIKKIKSSNPSPTSAYFPDTNGNKKDTKSKVEGSPKSKAATTANNSTAPSPKPVRTSVPTGSGAGLLGDFLGGGNKEEDFRAPNIYIHVPINGETNKYINFAKLAEDKYGFAAMNPRLAKAKMQMDSDNDMEGSESESNVDMGGTSDGAKKRKKRKYQDVYDKDDPFIDDSELLWEEQAASSKDGFFVYSGPLVPEGEKPQIERADGTMKRGRGRGRGSRGGATSTRAGAAAARKPRITKKEKEKLEKEKEERERFARAAASAKGLQPH
ncbi:hypothetical protein FN846DRAFT_923093 [Sphaerosporella brunnea]|uniref:Hpc2-related domain-containing protein n=1 Tax=Sphaerosporella brunnea TaxID=1250544 RepID=A0A5J5EFZ0_9PEZI|nr:hypothetical protein FN846DRAFT_923093 [Sphaerosporella brunnea]